MNGPEQLADWLSRQRQAGARVIGLNGAQGSGKSTLAAQLQALLRQRHGLRAVVLALDDLYLPRAERERLARQVHPLLRTRGVPGTHEVALGINLLEELAVSTGPVRVPSFVKAIDDRAPETAWHCVPAPADLVLFEGWCVATPAQDEAALRQPLNELEAREDADCRWRRWVNEQLATAYPPLFRRIDRTVFLQAPDFDSIFRWRMQQEAQNVRTAGGGAAAMDPAALRRFIQHYERLTRHALEVMPAGADAVITLGAKHEWRELQLR
ncbi:MAG TPA: hypothetical protein VFA75_21215 [Nevskia sp.]|nr:hypothetical protein [Nevskia sp.]